MVMLPSEMLEEIEQYKDDYRIRTRNKAIRTLIQKGLEEVAQDSQEAWESFFVYKKKWRLIYEDMIVIIAIQFSF